MGTHSKKKTVKTEGGIKTTSYQNIKPGPDSNWNKSVKIKPATNFAKERAFKNNKPTAYGMASADIKKKVKKNYGGA